MTKKTKITSYFIVVFCLSFLGIPFFVVANNDEHEGHVHGEGKTKDVQHEYHLGQKEADPHEKHAGHSHEDHSGHDHGEGWQKDEKHAEHEHGDHGEHSDEVTLTEEAIHHFKIRIEEVQRARLIPKITTPARVTFNADRLAHVGSSVSGRVKEVRYRIGDRVRKDEILLVVDSPELGKLQSEFLQKRIEAQVAEIALEVTKIEYERAQKLIEGKGISQAQFLEVEGKYKMKKGATLTAKSTVQALKSRLQIFGITPEQIDRLIRTEKIESIYNIVAPISGEIIEREATLGEVVKPDDHALMIIADLATVWVIASVPELKTPLVKVVVRQPITKRNSLAEKG